MEEEARDSRLDVNSPDFDPFLALYSDRVALPRPDALVLDNVAKYESLVVDSEGSLVRIDELLHKKQSKKKQPEPSTSKELEPRFSKAQGYQEAVPEKKKRSKPIKNVLTRISRASGPLAFLRDCMEKRIRIKVWTRNASGLRGYCLGFLIAFDKHWNLALSDVKEVWSRRVKRKRIIFGDVKEKGQELLIAKKKVHQFPCDYFLIRIARYFRKEPIPFFSRERSKEIPIEEHLNGFEDEISKPPDKSMTGKEFDLPKEWKVLGPMVTPPKVVVLNTEKGMQTCERHVNQMLMRGEHIAFISVTDA